MYFSTAKLNKTDMNIMLPEFRNYSPFIKLLFLLIIIFTGLITISFLGLLVAIPVFETDTVFSFLGGKDFNNSNQVAFLKYMQIISHFAIFIIPAFFYAWLFENGWNRFFMFSKKINVYLMFFGAVVMLSMLPFVNYLVEINKLFHLPQSMQNIEKWMKLSEKTAEEIIKVFLNTKTISGLIVNLFMIAIIPAIGEELIFRGIIQRNLSQWFGNAHIAVFVTAFIFSVVHLQFYGFFPRLFLGGLLGYMFLWTGNIWLPIFAHFINNATAVSVAWLYTSGYIKTDMSNLANFNHNPTLVICFSLFAFFSLLLFWYITKKTTPSDNSQTL